MSTINILVGGDVCPTARNFSSFQRGDAAALFHDLLEEMEKADLRVVNLECPLIESESPIPKTGPVLGAEGACIHGLKAARIDVVGLANNHVLDHGEAGLRTTLAACARVGIATVGAGADLEAAQRPFLTRLGGVRVAILAVAEHEWSIATEDSWGAAPLDLIENVRIIRRYRAEYDYLIVLLHGGNEHYPFPSPRLMETCRFLVEEGANAVLCQHSHCAGCYENYQNGHIVYGQGNFIFDSPGREAAWHEGFLVRLSIRPDFSSTMEIIPYTQSGEEIGARKMQGEQAQAFLETIRARSEAIQDKAFVRAQWAQFCAQKRHWALGQALGFNRLMHRFNRGGKLVRLLYSDQALRYLHNVVRCEAHHETLLTILDARWQRHSQN